VVIEQVRAMIKQEEDFVAKTEKAYADANKQAVDPKLSTNAYKGKNLNHLFPTRIMGRCSVK
jgi:hypothetical protein